MLGSQPEHTAATLKAARLRSVHHSYDKGGFLYVSNDVLRLLGKREGVRLPQTRCNDHVFKVLVAGNDWGGLSSLARGSRRLKDQPLPYGSASNKQAFLRSESVFALTLEHYGGVRRQIPVSCRFLERRLWCSARLSCTRLAPPCSKLGSEREESAGADHTMADDESSQNTAVDATKSRSRTLTPVPYMSLRTRGLRKVNRGR